MTFYRSNLVVKSDNSEVKSVVMKSNIYYISLFYLVFVIFIASISLPNAVYFGPVANTAADEHTVKIGFLNPSTGPIAVYSEAFSDAAQIAIDHLNEDSDTHTFELVEADSGCDGTTAATAAQSLIDAGVIGIAGAACSGATLGAMEVAKTAGVPMVSYASLSPALTTADDGGYLFRVVPSDAQQGMAMASMAASQGWQNPGIIFMSNDYGAGLAAVVKGAYATAGIDMCVDISYSDDNTDFSSQVAEIAAAGCDSLITVTYASDGAALLEEMVTQGIQGPTSPLCSEDCPFPVIGADGIADMNFLKEFSDPFAAISVIATKPSLSFSSDISVKFDEAWASSGKNSTNAIYIHETYDAVSIIGMAAAADFDGDLRDDINNLGSGTGFVGGSGTHIFDSNGDVVGPGYEICQFNSVAMDDGPGLVLVCNGHWELISGLSFPGAALIPIGMLNPSTGPLADFAPGFSIAGNISIQYMNTISPLNFQFSLTEADSSCDGTVAATAAQSLIDAGVIGIAGAACSGATLGAMEVAKTAGVPMVSYASVSPALTTADDGGYLFRVVPSDAQQGAALADAYEASGYESPALLSMTNDYGSNHATAFKDNYDGDICAESTHADDTTDFSSMIETVMSSDCDSVVMITYAYDGAAIVEELAIQEFDGMILGGDGIANITFANEFSDASLLEGLTVTKPAAATSSSLGMLFDSTYYPTAQSMGYEGGIYTKEVFDAVTIIGLAQVAAYRTPITTDRVVEQLGVNVAGPDAPQLGASGVHVFDANGDVGGSGFEVCVFRVAGEDNTIELDCHSSWSRDSGLMDYGIAKKPMDGCMDSTADNYNANAVVDDGSCIIPDYDEDGWLDYQDAFPEDPAEWADSDGDGIGDNSDPDVDGDGYSDVVEISFGSNPLDFDSKPLDLDSDYIPDSLDSDIDGDGISNLEDAFPSDSSEWLDTDGDGIGDNSDTFASVANNIVYAAGGMTIGLLGLVGLEMGSRRGIPEVLNGLERLISEGVETEKIVNSIENLRKESGFGGLSLLSNNLFEARKTLYEGLATEQKIVETMEDLALFREEVTLMEYEGMEVSDMLDSIRGLELKLAQQTQEDTSVKYLERLQSKFVKNQEGDN